MVEKKPTYDDLQSEYRMFSNGVWTFLHLTAFLFYSILLASIFILAEDGLTFQSPLNPLPAIIYEFAFLFLWLYGIWQLIAGLIHLWWGDAETMIESFAEDIEWFFLKLTAKDVKPKKVQTELPVNQTSFQKE
jgi:hypothetical protein